MFKKISEIRFLHYISRSLEYYENVDLESFSLIPGICISGKNDMTIQFSTINRENVKINFRNPEFYNFDSYLLWKSLDHGDIKNRALLDKLGLFFNANLKRAEPNVYNYKIEKPDGRNVIPSLNYFKNKIDHTQYLMLSTTMTPEERTSEQCGLYIDRLWQVEFDHDEFMSLINK